MKKTLIYLAIQIIGQMFASYLAYASGNPWGSQPHGDLCLLLFLLTGTFGTAVFIPK